MIKSEGIAFAYFSKKPLTAGSKREKERRDRYRRREVLKKKVVEPERDIVIGAERMSFNNDLTDEDEGCGRFGISKLEGTVYCLSIAINVQNPHIHTVV